MARHRLVVCASVCRPMPLVGHIVGPSKKRARQRISQVTSVSRHRHPGHRPVPPSPHRACADGTVRRTRRHARRRRCAGAPHPRPARQPRGQLGAGDGFLRRLRDLANTQHGAPAPDRRHRRVLLLSLRTGSRGPRTGPTSSHSGAEMCPVPSRRSPGRTRSSPRSDGVCCAAPSRSWQTPKACVKCPKPPTRCPCA